MLRVPRDRTFRRLFAAQIVALVGTGLATVALALLAFDLAGERAGAVLGTALAVKMLAYVTVAPVASALLARVPRRGLLVGLNLARAGVVLALPLVTAVWQVYALVFVLQAVSAAYTPAFQATIPDVLRDERDYTRALSLSRLAYDLESLASPLLAAALLLVMSFSGLFAGTAVGFLLAAGLVLAAAPPAAAPAAPGSLADRATRGLRRYLATPRLRGLLALTLAAAAGGAMVIVNTVVIVRTGLGLGETEVALALGAFGAGSMLVAVFLAELIERTGDRRAMIAGAALLAAAMVLGPLVATLPVLLALWFGAGAGSALVQTPTGRLLRRSAPPGERPALFAAHFALSHAVWLPAYLLAGHAATALGPSGAFLLMAALAVSGLVAGSRAWPADDAGTVRHSHPGLPADHPHLRDHPVDAGRRHSHAFVLDGLHPAWGRGL